MGQPAEERAQMPTNKLPPIELFVVAAIKRMRPKASTVRSVAPGGVPLYRVAQRALEVYREDSAVRYGIHAAIRSRKVVLIAEYHHSEKGRSLNREILEKVPENLPINARHTYLDAEWTPAPSTETTVVRLRALKLYIPEDGFPGKVAGVTKTAVSKLTQEILDSIKK